MRIFLQNVDILSCSKVTLIQRRQGFENIGKIPYKKIVAFFQLNFYAPAEFEKSTGHMRLKIYTHGQVKGLYKRCAAIFLILPNFEIMTP